MIAEHLSCILIGAFIDKSDYFGSENTVFKSEIVEFLNKGGKFSISDLQNSIDSLKELSNQRVSAILKQLVDSGEVVKTYEKRKAFFSRVGD